MDRGKNGRKPSRWIGRRSPGVPFEGIHVPTGDWKRELNILLRLHGGTTNQGQPKPVSNRTLDAREEILYMCVKQIRDLGYKIESVRAIKGRHIEALVEKWKEERISAGTIQNRLAALRGLAKWLGKEGMVMPTKHYAMEDPGRLKRTLVADRDKSWTMAGVSPEDIIREASLMDKYVGMQLKVIRAFGLRREEAIQFKPFKVDEGGVLRIRDGTKGGRERMVPVESEYQKQVVHEAKQFVSKWDKHIGRPDKSLKQNIDRFSYIMRKLGITRAGLGVTAHGLRHQRLNDIFEEVAGIPSAVRQMAATGTVTKDVDLWKLAQQKVSNVAGHSRLSIAGAYCGSPRSVKVKTSADIEQQNGQTSAADTIRHVQPAAVANTGLGTITWLYQTTTYVLTGLKPYVRTGQDAQTEGVGQTSPPVE